MALFDDLTKKQLSLQKKQSIRRMNLQGQPK